MKTERGQLHIGPLTRGGQGRHQVHQRLDLSIPTRVTNASSREPLTLSRWNVREGADQHLQYQSRGIRA